MIQCKTYNEARMDCINLLSNYDCDIFSIKIYYDTINDCFWIDYDNDYTIKDINEKREPEVEVFPEYIIKRKKK